MMAAVRHGLGNLLNFAGRDARQAFWYYVLSIYVATVLVTLVVIVPLTIQMLTHAIREGVAAAEAGDQAAAELAVQSGIGNAMTEMMTATMTVGTGTNAVMLLLLAASVVRRLHDSSLSGLWALLPGGVHVANLFLAPVLMRRMLESMAGMSTGDPAAQMEAMQGQLGAASLLGWAALLIVIVIGIRKSTPGPNRYGEAPFVA